METQEIYNIKPQEIIIRQICEKELIFDQKRLVEIMQKILRVNVAQVSLVVENSLIVAINVTISNSFIPSLNPNIRIYDYSLNENNFNTICILIKDNRIVLINKFIEIYGCVPISYRIDDEHKLPNSEIIVTCRRIESKEI